MKNIKEIEHDFVVDSIIRASWTMKPKSVTALRLVIRMHSPQEITLPDGSWGVNCIECDGYVYPCATMQAITTELRSK